MRKINHIKLFTDQSLMVQSHRQLYIFMPSTQETALLNSANLLTTIGHGFVPKSKHMVQAGPDEAIV